MTETLESLRVLMAPIILMVCGMLVLLLDLRRSAFALRKSLALVCQFGLVLAAVACFPALNEAGLVGVKFLGADSPVVRLFGSGMTMDGFSGLLDLTLCLVAALVIGMSGRYLEDKKLAFGEFYALVLFSTAGAMVMVSALDLVNLFVGLEVLSVALYILAGYARRELRSEEAAVKYFLLGAFASGFLLYGIALIYGAVGLAAKQAGTALAQSSYTNVVTISELLQQTQQSAAPLASSPLFLTGIALLLVGLGFKASLVPFHTYAPDVYEGAPAPVAAFMSAAAKIGAFGALVRFLYPLALVEGQTTLVRNVLWGIALATMLVGNVLAIRQVNLKRMLAFSSVAHAGYLLVGVLASMAYRGKELIAAPLGALAADSVAFYLLAYALMNVGAFAVIVWLGTSDEDEFTDIRRFAGLAKRQPAAAATLTVLLFSLAGIPLTAGFLGKLYVFYAAVSAQLYWLAGLGLVISVIGVAYYLNLVVLMYFRSPQSDSNQEVRGGAARNVAIVCALLTLVLGVVPSGILGPTVIQDAAKLSDPSVPGATPELGIGGEARTRGAMGRPPGGMGRPPGGMGQPGAGGPRGAPPTAGGAPTPQ